MLIGVDVGSVAVKVVLMGSDHKVVEHHYRRIKGRPLRTVSDTLTDILGRYDHAKIRAVCATGAGGRLIAELLNGIFVNEVIAQYLAGLFFDGNVRTVIDIGGEESKLMLLSQDRATGEPSVSDFEMNTVCAAGTGSFLDQQATRLGLSIEDEFAELALKSKTPPRIAGRCSVFAKTDMIHLQQEGTPVYDIVGGLCYAMARSFKSNVVKGSKIRPLVSFQGGVASNRAMVKALKQVLGLNDGEMLVHELHGVAGAIGACLHYLGSKDVPEQYFEGLSKLDEFLLRPSAEEKHLPMLSLENVVLPRDAHVQRAKMPKSARPLKVYLGIDVGSISTNVVAIDDDLNLLAKCYLMTAGRPIDAVARGLSEVGEELPRSVKVAGVGTTGSGRYMTGEVVGADTVRNEITAQATAAAVIDPDVDTIFEIGGQDSKYIGLENGVVVDFEMNKVCAAGTGSFLEEQAEKLGVSIKREFADEALGSRTPVRLGERCTVFMESSVTHFQQEGAKRENLLAGLAYSIVYNYLNRVVGTKKVGNNIFFQGGVAFNRSVCAAFSAVTGKRITVPPNHEVTGAIGAAMLAKDAMKGRAESKFKGFDLKDRKWELKTFECHDCANVCEIREVTMEGEPPIYYGSRCEKYDVRKKAATHSRRIPDLFAEREKLLMRWHSKPAERASSSGMTIGIPRALLFFELYPMWSAFFRALGFETVLSAKTNKHVIHEGVESVKAETCFPVKVMHGHVLDLVKKGVDKIFLPSVINMPIETKGFVNYYNCPLVQSIPYTIRCGIDGLQRERILSPILYLQRGKKDTVNRLVRFAHEDLGVSRSDARRAAEAAMAAQQEFTTRQIELVNRAEQVIREYSRAVVIIGRPYNTSDAFVNLNLPKKLRELDVLAVPMDLVRPDVSLTLKEHSNMYWRYGQRILGTAVSIAKDPRLYGLYITNFGCGPDSFIARFFSEIMGEKPFLQIEIDEHSADVGAITRCEAFLDSIEGKKHRAEVEPRLVENRASERTRGVKDKTLYVPSMSDHAHPFCAALERFGINAQVIPEADEESLELGRRYTSGRECFPCIVTTGDMVKLCQGDGFDADKAMFLMPTTSGPCRFGQYSHAQRMVLEAIGFPDVPILAPDQDRTGDFHGTLKDVPLMFYFHGYRGMVSVDYIERLARRIRPYEKVPGRTDEVYGYCLKEITRATREGDVLSVLPKCSALFARIERVKTQMRPRIGVVGEIYVRSHRFSNQNIVTRLEALGAEVWMPPFAEWTYYLTFIHARDATSMGKWWGFTKLRSLYLLQRLGERTIREAIGDSMGLYQDEPVAHAIHAASPYLDASFHGESILSIGKMVEFIENGATGVINLMPFGCLPGTIVTSMLKKLHEDFDGIPALSINYDGLEDPAEQTRLEAFVHQAKQRAERMQARGEKPRY